MKIANWTPMRVKDRLVYSLYLRANPDAPWLTPAATEALDSYLLWSDVGLEFGSGRSTLWFAKRVAHLTSIEHDEVWAAKVREMLSIAAVNNVDYRHMSKEGADKSGRDSEYVRVLETFQDDSLDFCLVDGAYRNHCAKGAIDKIRPGGVLIIDNVNWFLPSDSRSPASRSRAQGPAVGFKGFEQAVSGWRRIWTSSGKSDTALFFKPCGGAYPKRDRVFPEN